MVRDTTLCIVASAGMGLTLGFGVEAVRESIMHSLDVERARIRFSQYVESHPDAQRSESLRSRISYREDTAADRAEYSALADNPDVIKAGEFYSAWKHTSRTDSFSAWGIGTASLLGLGVGTAFAAYTLRKERIRDAKRGGASA